MLSKDELGEIKEYEEAGIDIVVLDSGGTLKYATKGMGGSEQCDQCSAFRLFFAPDSNDGFRIGRELSEEEKKKAAERLKWAKERMK